MQTIGGVKNGSRDITQEVQARDSVTCGQELKWQWREVGRYIDKRQNLLDESGVRCFLGSGLRSWMVTPFTRGGLNLWEKIMSSDLVMLSLKCFSDPQKDL